VLNIENIISKISPPLSNLMGTAGTLGTSPINPLNINHLDLDMMAPKLPKTYGDARGQSASVPNVPTGKDQKRGQHESIKVEQKQTVTAVVPSVPNVPTQNSNSVNDDSAIELESFRQQIETSISDAINLDGGALNHCQHFRPDLHRDCITASLALDDAYATKDAKKIKRAIWKHDKACELTRQAALNPMKANRLSPDEVTRFCNAHMIQQGGQCPYKGKLAGCKIWEAKNHQVTIEQLMVPPEQYLDIYHQ